jgi:hypothetical protein
VLFIPKISHKDTKEEKSTKEEGRGMSPLLLLLTAVFTGATLCGIIHLHGFAVRLFSACEAFGGLL